MITTLLHRIFSVITIEMFHVSVGLFVSGLLLSVWIVKKQIRFLLWYPEWIWKKLKNFLGTKPGFSKLFLLIFLLNASSLFCNLISGFGVVLPVFFAILIGMNVGIIAYEEGGIKALILMFFAPHAIFELPAAWLSIALGIRLGMEIITPNANIRWIFYQNLSLYLCAILPLLFIAALIESALIYFSIKKLQHPSTLPQEPFDAQKNNNSNE